MNPKNPKIDLSGIPRVNPDPLRQKLKALRNTRTEIASLQGRHTALEAEVRQLLETGDAEDEKQVEIISSKRVKLDIMPHVIARMERSLESDLAPALLVEADKFRAGLRRFYDDAHAAFASSYADIFRRYFSDLVESNGERVNRSHAVAIQTDDCREVMMRKTEADNIRLPGHSPRSNSPERFDRDLCEGVDALLALAERS